MQRKKKVLAILAAGLLAGAFGLGITGIPGQALWAAFDWAVEEGYVELSGPVGEAVRGALG